MKPSEAEIEVRLRHAPQPAPPAGLKEKLCAQLELAAPVAPGETRIPAAKRGWFRWWPVMAPAAACIALAAWAAVQRQEIAALQETVQQLQSVIQAATNRPPERVEAIPPDRTVVSEGEAAELERLKQRVTTLQGEVRQLEGVQTANARLHEQIVAAGATLSQSELDAMNEAKARAMRINCINNLKQVGLAVRLYMADNNEVCPPDFMTMSNELNTPKILFCPANTNLPSVRTWPEFATTSSSYQYLVAGVTNADIEPERILTYCPTHNIFGLCDGSVQDCSKRRYEDCVVERDSKLYLQLKPATRSNSQP